MDFFYEILKNRIGFSRVGRINEIGSSKPVKTPNIVIPINKTLMNNFDFVDTFGCHEIFIISDEIYLDEQFLDGMFIDSGFFYYHKGTVQRFTEILEKKKDLIEKNKVVPILPFSIPTTTVNFEFAEKELVYYLNKLDNILKNHPAINFGLSIRFFDYYEVLERYKVLIQKHNNIKLLNFLDIFDNLRFFRNKLEAIIKLKDELDNNLVLMVSGRVLTKYIPIIVYLGFDLINSSYLTHLSAESFYDTIDNLIPAYKVRYLPCNCLSCQNRLKGLLEEKYSADKIDLLCYHNFIVARNYMNKTIQYLHTEDFRALVEKSSLNELNFKSLLKICDKNYFEQLKYHSKMIQKNREITCLGPISYNRPDFEYFRRNVLNTFTPEPWTKLIILLPCSAKKPYSQSRSHQKFYDIIRQFSEFPSFQEIILTSPLGAIPRQLENIYPVNSYEISVTGDWNTEEIEIAANMLSALLNKFDKDIPVICHLDGGYLDIAKETEKSVKNQLIFSNVDDHLTSDDALKKLENNLQNNISEFKPKMNISSDNKLTKSWRRKFSKIIDYQFGMGFGEKLISENVRYKRDHRNTRFYLEDKSNGDQLGTFKFSTGKIRLSIKGAERIAYLPDFSNFIIFDGTVLKGNTLFMPGIKNYAPNLLPDQNVCIFDQKKESIIAMGDMITSSRFIQNSTSGKVVKIYETR
jgi:archaeosine synthase